MLAHIKRSMLHALHTGIARFWVQPLEDLIIPRLENKSGWLPTLLWRLASWGANAGRVVVLEMRLKVIRWVGMDWSVCYIGTGKSAEQLCRLLFPTPPLIVEMPQSFLWQASRLAMKYADQGDLVVVEVNKILQLTPTSSGISFTVPGWVSQVLERIARPMDEILAGMNQAMRRKIRRIDGQGYSYSFTQAQEDFDLFYHRMYAPYIHWRHGVVTLHSYEDMNNRFKDRGGLILVRQGQELVCGMLCLLKDGECVAMEMGVMDGRFELVKQGSNVALWWFMLDWARRHGAHQFNFGISAPQTSNGTFNFKRQWGTRVVRDLNGCPRWRFYSKDLPVPLRQYLNEQGWISEISGGHYLVKLQNLVDADSEASLNDWLDMTTSCGLEGLMIISPLGDRKIIPIQSSLFAHRRSNNPLQPSF